MLPDAYLDAALADFSGYPAIDEVYDGPFCILSVVDNRRYRRLALSVLDHAPTHDDIRAFLAGFKAELDRRRLAVRGITTDGSNLYPVPLAGLWPGVPHQVCTFHVIKDITQAILHALAQFRKDLTGRIPTQRRGRPRRGDRRRAARVARQKRRVADLFEHRHLFVRRQLTDAEKGLLRRLTRGQPPLRTLRGIMDEVYRLFDRRCKSATALRKLAALRRRVKRFARLRQALGKLWSPTLDKALVFLDDTLLPATSNAVERGNRRFRKAQAGVYSVRTKRQLERRLALDLHREQRADARRKTLHTLHKARAQPADPH